MENIFASRLSALRQRMAREHWDAVIIGRSDPHASEYVAARWQQVQWLSGFSGEAGDIVVTQDHAGLWTDTRYFIQAAQQLPGTGFELHKTNVPDQVLIPQWLANHPWETECPRITLDVLCHSAADVREIVEALGGDDKCHIVGIPDLLSDLWRDRPAIPQTTITLLDDVYTGFPRSEKIAWLRGELAKRRADAMLLTTLDEIAWLLNIRGSDIDYNPVVISYLWVTPNEVRWFVRKSGSIDDVTRETWRQIESEGIHIEDYDAVDATIQAFAGRIFVDRATLNASLSEGIGDRAILGESPIILKKAIKTDVEIAGMRQCHIADGVAVVRFFHWVECELEAGHELSEWRASQQLDRFRAEIPSYRGNSFETISAWGAGAALPHYVTPKDDSTIIGRHGLYLVDSGGQYLNGTTDITRTVATGPCTPLECEDYTLALQGHIRLALCVFPQGTAGCQIDVIAREAMWRRCRNFGHGTGHGVGFYLNVHEGPQCIRQGFKNQPILPGMMTSNEPGLYREHQHGVRHENVMLCVDTGCRDFGREWYRFEELTMCWFDTRPILVEMLHDDERTWLNDYNERVYQTLHPYLDEETSTWLRAKTRAI